MSKAQGAPPGIGKPRSFYPANVKEGLSQRPALRRSDASKQQTIGAREFTFVLRARGYCRGNRKEMRMSHPSPFVLGSLAILMGAVLGSNAVAADSITIEANQVRVLTFDKPIKTVYIANPLIADITVIDSRRAFL